MFFRRTKAVCRLQPRVSVSASITTGAAQRAPKRGTQSNLPRLYAGSVSHSCGERIHTGTLHPIDVLLNRLDIHERLRLCGNVALGLQ